MKFIATLLLLLFFNGITWAEFMWPIARPKRITGTFAEYRGSRFHHGIDVSCSGRKGYKIYAADDGYVSSVMYQKWGIGYCIFIKHKNGQYSMYGHMDRFSKKILKNKIIKKYLTHIKNKKDFRVNFDKPVIKLKKGKVIGYSGDSGIGLEHLHFEIRDKNNNPVNPLRNGIRIRDKTAPVIKEITLVPMDPYSHVDGFSSEASFDAKIMNKRKKIYGIDGNIIPEIAGRIGIKITAYDHAGYRNKVALYGIKSYLNNKHLYTIKFDKIKRELSYRMGLYYDYDNSSYSKYTYYLYSKENNSGILNIRGNEKARSIKIICFDANNNRSIITFKFKAGNKLSKPDYKYKKNLFKGKPLIMLDKENKFSISFNKKSAIYDEMINIIKEPPFRSGMRGLTVKSSIYSLSPTNLCLNKPATIRIRYNKSDITKVGIYGSTGSSSRFYFMGNQYDSKSGTFKTRIKKLGSFFLVKDDSPPRIRYRNKKRFKRKKNIKIYISDIGSGVDLSRVFLKVDNRDVFWDYEPDKHYIEIFKHNRIWKRGKHKITIKLMDRAGNKSKKKTFKYYY